MKINLEVFKKMTLTKKIVFCFFCFFALLSISEGRLVGTIISSLIAYCVYQYSKLPDLVQPTISGNASSSLSSEDEFRRQQQVIQDEAYRVEEEQRLEDERVANQEALDRLL